jgi:hypothetical protein
MATLGVILLTGWTGRTLFRVPEGKENMEPEESDGVQFRIYPCIRLDSSEERFLRIEIINRSKEPIEIEYEKAYWPHENLTVHISDADGKEVVCFSYKLLKSSLGETSMREKMTIPPGQVYVADVAMSPVINHLAKNARASGIYKLSCTFECSSKTLESPAVSIALAKSNDE